MTMYGREDAEWEQLIEAGLAFLIERARMKRVTSYTELNSTLVRRTGLRGFDFEREDERAAMGYLLGLIVDRTYPITGLMISGLVHYLNANDAGSGFYVLAVRLGKLRRGADKDEFWVRELNDLYDHYAAAGPGPVK